MLLDLIKIKEYYDSNKTIGEVANYFQIPYAKVRNILFENKIPIKSSTHIKRLKRCYLKELYDKDWLYRKYIIEKLSLLQIGNLLNVNFNLIRNSLCFYDIPLRTKSQGQKLRHNKEDYFKLNESFITGSLLGDGGLSKYNKFNKESLPYFSQGTIHYDHAIWIANQIFSKNPEARIRDCNNYTSLGGSKIFRITSITQEELVPFFEKWYPEKNNYKKIIPEDLDIDNVVLLNWFLGDGYSYYVKRKNANNSFVRVQFSTQSFECNELKILCEKIYKKFDLKIYPRFHQKHGIKSGTGYFLDVSERQIEEFFNLIGPCPVASLAYKWKFPERKRITLRQKKFIELLKEK